MLLRTDPFRDVDRLTARIFDTTARSTDARSAAARNAAARLDAYSDGDVFVVEIDLPGVDPSAIDVTVDRRVLTVRAERRRVERDGVRHIVDERPMGAVSRRLFLSDTLDTDRLEAAYDAGVLRLRIPVTEQAKPRRIEISAGTTGREPVAA